MDWSVERRDKVAVCTFTRPPRNFMSMAAMTELESVLKEFQTAAAPQAGSSDSHARSWNALNPLQRRPRAEQG